MSICCLLRVKDDQQS